jgi:hypothetical protein
MDGKGMVAIDTRELPWEERFNEKLGRLLYRKNLMTDPDTGMEVRLVRYPAAVINVRHTHPCAHGMYVLEGTLATHAGNHGPGTFVLTDTNSMTYPSHAEVQVPRTDPKRRARGRARRRHGGRRSGAADPV